jgi:lysophospholipase L1-like esterase
MSFFPKYLLIGFILLFGVQPAFSQNNIKWWNPVSSSYPVIDGQGWYKGLAHPYDRLPADMKNRVRKPVWYLSQDCSGLIIRFRTNASDIHVRYTVGRKIALPHMPATGVSGVDLYVLGKNGRWQWAAGKYQFSDTIEYHFSHLKHGPSRVYHLYLPLYNNVKWLEIGVPAKATMNPQPVISDKPIVIYGTSIAQGIAASRPGMDWAAILGRRLHMPVINLSFSGNGRLEQPIINLMKKLNAKIYILACMPNMWYSFIPSDTVKKRLVRSVKTLKNKRPNVPILLVEDADANIMSLDTSRYAPYKRVNGITDSIFIKLKNQGIKGIYLLTAKEIGLNSESTTEGTHPNDYGMEQYANAYEKVIRKIFDIHDLKKR